MLELQCGEVDVYVTSDTSKAFVIDRKNIRDGGEESWLYLRVFAAGFTGIAPSHSTSTTMQHGNRQSQNVSDTHRL